MIHDDNQLQLTDAFQAFNKIGTRMTCRLARLSYLGIIARSDAMAI